MDEQKSMICWIKKHRKELVATGVCIGALVLVVLGLQNQEEIKAVSDSLRKKVKRPAAALTKAVTEVTEDVVAAPIQSVITTATTNRDTAPFEVSRHIRNLPSGHHASQEKIEGALRNNIILLDGQTWVDNYVKGSVAV